MNKFDRAVNKKASELMAKGLMGQEVYAEDFKRFKEIARAMIREELRKAKPSDKPKSLYQKTWKAAAKYDDLPK